MNDREPEPLRNRWRGVMRVSRLLYLAGFIKFLMPGPAMPVQFNVTITDERVIVDDSDSLFLGAEIRAPQFCPYDTNWLSFEVRKEKAFYLYLYNRANARLTEVIPGRNGRSDRINGKGPGGSVQTTDFDWRPEPGPGSARWFVFSSNVAGSFDVWLGDAVSGLTVRIPAKDEGKNERGPKWSPDGRLVAFWSDATNQGDIYLLNYVTDLLSSDTTKRLDPPIWLVKDPGLDYEIRWYPGKKSGYLAYTHQDQESEQTRRVEIRVCDIVNRRVDMLENISPGTYLRSASWNPTGRGDLAFYQADEFPGPGTDVTWGVGMASVKMANADKGTLELRVRRPAGRSTGEIEKSVQPSHDLRFGPVWTPDGNYLALTRRYEDIQNPVWLYEMRSWEFALPYRSDRSFAPAYKFPRDVSISDNQIAFVYSDGPSRKLLAARLSGDDFRIPKPVTVWPLVTESRSKRYDWMFIDRPGIGPKIWHWASRAIFKPNFVLNTRGVISAAVVGVAVYVLTKPGVKQGPREIWNPPGFGD